MKTIKCSFFIMNGFYTFSKANGIEKPDISWQKPLALFHYSHKAVLQRKVKYNYETITI